MAETKKLNRKKAVLAEKDKIGSNLLLNKM